MKELRQKIEALETPALTNHEDECGECGMDISLETYDSFDDGYSMAIQDILKIMESRCLD